MAQKTDLGAAYQKSYDPKKIPPGVPLCTYCKQRPRHRRVTRRCPECLTGYCLPCSIQYRACGACSTEIEYWDEVNPEDEDTSGVVWHSWFRSNGIDWLRKVKGRTPRPPAPKAVVEAPEPPLWQQVQELQTQVKHLVTTVQQKDNVIADLEQKLEQLMVDKEREPFRQKCRLSFLEEQIRCLERRLPPDNQGLSD